MNRPVMSLEQLQAYVELLEAREGALLNTIQLQTEALEKLLLERTHAQAAMHGPVSEAA